MSSENKSELMEQLAYFERLYYGFQTEGRGLIDASDLTAAFESAARRYDELLLGHLAGRENEPALDLGCGYGNFLYYLRKKGFGLASGVDLDPNQVALANSLGLTAVVGGVDEHLAASPPLGLIVALDLIEHLSKNNAIRLLELAHQKLQPGGLLIIQCPCADGFTGAHDTFNDLTHQWSASSNMLKQLLMAIGFARVTVLDLTLTYYPGSIGSRLKNLTRKLARKCANLVFKILGIKAPAIWSNSQMAIAWKSTTVFHAPIANRLD